MSEPTKLKRMAGAAFLTAVGIPVALVAAELAVSAGVKQQFAVGLAQSLLMPLPFVGWALADQVLRPVVAIVQAIRKK